MGTGIAYEAVPYATYVMCHAWRINRMPRVNASRDVNVPCEAPEWTSAAAHSTVERTLTTNTERSHASTNRFSSHAT